MVLNQKRRLLMVMATLMKRLEMMKIWEWRQRYEMTRFEMLGRVLKMMGRVLEMMENLEVGKILMIVHIWRIVMCLGHHILVMMIV